MIKIIMFLLFSFSALMAQPTTILNLKPSPKAGNCGCLSVPVQKITIGKDGKETVKDGIATLYQDVIITSIGTEVHQLTLDSWPYYYDEKDLLLKISMKDQKIIYKLGKSYYLINL